MSKVLIIGTESFDFPVEGDGPGYGESVTSWAEAVTSALSTVQAPNDVITQSAAIINGQATFANIPGFIFNSSQVISINAEFIVKRTTVTPLNNLVESGFIQGNYNGSEWVFSVHSTGGNAGVDFDITPAGQLRYTSTSITGSAYSGTISFRGKVFNS